MLFKIQKIHFISARLPGSHGECLKDTEMFHLFCTSFLVTLSHLLVWNCVVMQLEAPLNRPAGTSSGRVVDWSIGGLIDLLNM